MSRVFKATAVTLAIAAATPFVTFSTGESEWQLGEIFLAVGDLAFRDTKGKYAVLRPDATRRGEFLTDRNRGYTGGCVVDPATGSLWTTSRDGNTISQFDPIGDAWGEHALLHTISVRSMTWNGGRARGAVGSLVFDAAGHLLAGTYDGTNRLLKFTAGGALVDAYELPAGVLWFDLAADQHTVFYTSTDTVVRRYDLATRSPLPDFAVVADGSIHALRLLPNDQGLLVAGSVGISRFDLDGTLVTRHWLPAVVGFQGLNITPDGREFWTYTQTAQLYRFDIATGRRVAGPIHSGFARLWGSCVKFEYTAAEDLCRRALPDGSAAIATCPRLEACTANRDDDLDGLRGADDPDCQ